MQSALKGGGTELLLGHDDLQSLPELGLLAPEILSLSAETVEVVDGDLLTLLLVDAATGGLHGDVLDELLVVDHGIVVLLDEGNGALHLGLADEGTLTAHGLVDANRGVEHITAADELVGTHRINDGTGVYCRCHGKGDTGRNVGLDQTRDDVHRGTLGTDDQMDARGSRLLGQTADGGLHVGGGCHHQVGQLVDDDDDLRHGGTLGISCGDLIVARQVTDAHLLDEAEAALHLVDGAVERTCGLLGVGDDGAEQVGQLAVHGELHLLGVDEDELDLVGLGLVEDTHDDGVDTHRLTHTRCTCDEQVGHLVDVQNDGTTRHVGAQAGGDAALVVAELGGLQNVAEVDGGGLSVGHLDTHGGLAGNGSLDTHARLSQVHGDIVHQVGDGADTDARVGLDLKAGDGGAAGAGDLLDADVEALQHLAEQAGVFRDLLVVGLVAGATLGEHIHRRELVLAGGLGGKLGGIVGRGQHQLLLRESRFGHGGVFLLVDGDHESVGGLGIGLVDHRIAASGGSSLGGGHAHLIRIRFVGGIAEGQASLLVQIGVHGVCCIVVLGLAVVHQLAAGRGGGRTGILGVEFLGNVAAVAILRCILPIQLGTLVALLLLRSGTRLLSGGRLKQGQDGLILVLVVGSGRLGRRGRSGGSLLLQHLSRLGIHQRGTATGLTGGLLLGLGRRLLDGLKLFILCEIGIVVSELGAALGISGLLPLLAVGFGQIGATLGLSGGVLLLTAGCLLLAADLTVLGGHLTAHLDGGFDLPEHVGGGHADEKHEDQGQDHNGQSNGAGELQTCVQGISGQTADHTAALEDGTRAEEMAHVVDLRQISIRGAYAHVDDSGDQDHEQDRQNHLHGHQTLLTVAAPEDSQIQKAQGEEVRRPAQASEQDAANVVADHAARMGLGRIGTIQHVQDQEHSEHKGEGAEYVGQELLGEGTSALDLGGLLAVVLGLGRLFGGGADGIRSCLGLGGSLGRGGSGHGSLPLGGRPSAARGGGLFLLVRIGHIVTS